MKIEWLFCGRLYREVNYRSVPKIAVRDWLLYGRQFDQMKFGCVPGAVIHIYDSERPQSLVLC